MVVVLEGRAQRTLVKLNQKNKVPSGSAPLTVIGMGTQGENKGSAKKLREVTVNNVPTSSCQSQFNSGWIDPKTMLCAASFGSDACFGDSGGKLLSSSVIIIPGLIIVLFLYLYAHTFPIPMICTRTGPLINKAGIQVGVVSACILLCRTISTQTRIFPHRATSLTSREFVGSAPLPRFHGASDAHGRSSLFRLL